MKKKNKNCKKLEKKLNSAELLLFSKNTLKVADQKLKVVE